jgi:hypothetical protein
VNEVSRTQAQRAVALAASVFFLAVTGPKHKLTARVDAAQLDVLTR